MLSVDQSKNGEKRNPLGEGRYEFRSDTPAKILISAKDATGNKAVADASNWRLIKSTSLSFERPRYKKAYRNRLGWKNTDYAPVAECIFLRC